ncbi:fimbrillin family protein [Segatella paludivivens]|uniref:fimbrillin family protein n=1 Tax=Segatella paludivivens TaxID=185294 RepID=UPI000362731F|nr:fimbrillin family protein [Segatella paludivivens]
MGKKFLRGINVLLLLLIIISTFSSCANEINIFGENNNEQINFSVSAPEWKNTDSLTTTKTSRSTPITDNSFGTDKSFNLIADQNDGAGNYSTLIDKESVSFTNNIWQTTPSHYYWSGFVNKTVNFYAYYPSNISNVSHTAGSPPTLSYTVPDNVSDQIDIMTATGINVSGNTNSSTPLTFNHIFAAVKFSVGTNGLPSGTIKSITISGIKNSGPYTFGSGWALGSTTSSFTVSPSTTITGAVGANITSDTFTMMMIPQIFTNATITLTYNTGTSYKQTISGNWTAGTTYTYNLSKPVNIGDYYYNDGTWGTIAEHSNSTASPIGIIFSNSASNIDKGHNWAHGYAMALQNTGSSSATYQWYTSDSSNPTGTYINGLDDIMSDKDGYTHSCYLQASNYAAGIAANSYVAKDKNGNNVGLPIGTSGWFLPSSGQWYDICARLGGMATASGKNYTSGSERNLRWYSIDISGDTNNYSSLCVSDLNIYLNALRERGYSVDLFSNNNEYYWSSSEYSSFGACSVGFVSDGDVGLDYSCYGKTSSFRVRPIVAF